MFVCYQQFVLCIRARKRSTSMTSTTTSSAVGFFFKLWKQLNKTWSLGLFYSQEKTLHQPSIVPGRDWFFSSKVWYLLHSQVKYLLHSQVKYLLHYQVKYLLHSQAKYSWGGSLHLDFVKAGRLLDLGSRHNTHLRLSTRYQVTILLRRTLIPNANGPKDTLLRQVRIIIPNMKIKMVRTSLLRNSKTRRLPLHIPLHKSPWWKVVVLLPVKDFPLSTQ